MTLFGFIPWLAGLIISRKPSVTMKHATRLVKIGLVIVGVLGLGIGGCVAKQKYDASVLEKNRLENNAKAQGEDAVANAAASGQRVDDAVRAASELQALKETINDAPDPVAARRAYYRCVRVQQRAREAGEPAPSCTGPEGGPLVD